MSDQQVLDEIVADPTKGMQRFGGTFFCPMRISGTRSAWRKGMGEFVWRPSTIWLSADMQRRCLGLLITDGHPPTEDGFVNPDTRVVGVIVRTFTRPCDRGDELWGVGRIFDADILQEALAAADAGEPVDTSPTAAFGQLPKIDVDGIPMAIEDEPFRIDHLALLIGERGVWSRDSDELGIFLRSKAKETT